MRLGARVRVYHSTFGRGDAREARGGEVDAGGGAGWSVGAGVGSCSVRDAH